MRILLQAFIASTSIILFMILGFSPEKEEEVSVYEEVGESETEAIDALQFLSASYAYPGKDIPEEGFGRAYDFYRQRFLNQPYGKEPASLWQNIGPANCGGRTLCVAVDPSDTSNVWAGSASGGLWKSTKGGIGPSWTPVPTGFPALGISTIAFAPGNSKTIIIGTGETYAYGISTNGLIDRTTRGIFGIGILKSTDGGATWTQVLNWTYQQNRGVWDIKFNPLDPNQVYAATTEGIYKSADGGNTWKNIYPAEMAMDLLIDPVDTNVIYCGVGNLSSPNKGLYRSMNSGATWSILSNGLPSNTNRTGRITLAINPKNHKTILAHICTAFNTVGFYISRNQGTSWAARSSLDIASYQGWYSEGMVFDPVDSNRIVVAGVSIYKSSDMANNFSKISGANNVHLDFHDIVVNPLNPKKIYIATDGGVYRSNDFGTTFYSCSNGYVTSQFYIGAVSYQDPNIALAGAQDNGVWKFSGTPNWTNPIGADGCYTAIHPTSDLTMYGATQYLNVRKSTNKGVSFNTQVISSPSSSTGTNPTAFLAPFVVCPSNPQVMYAGGDSVIKSTNGGTNWSVVGPIPLDNRNIILSIGVSSTNKDTLYVGTAPTHTTAGIFRSGNGGTSFTNITGSLPNRYLRRITVDPKNSKIVYATFSGFGTGHIFKSTDAGMSWTDISTSLPDIPFHCLAVHPKNANTIFAGCDLGVFYSQDGGSTWSAFNAALPEVVMIFDLVVSPADNSLLAFTHGRGLYKRDLSDVVQISEPSLLDLNFTISPNPANTEVSFDLSCNENIQGDLSIYNVNGRKMTSVPLNAKNKTWLDVSLFDAGVYFAEIFSGNRFVSRKFVVIR